MQHIYHQTHNQLLKHRSGHYVASTGQPLLRSVCRLAKRWYDSPCQAGHDNS